MTEAAASWRMYVLASGIIIYIASFYTVLGVGSLQDLIVARCTVCVAVLRPGADPD